MTALPVKTERAPWPLWFPDVVTHTRRETFFGHADFLAARSGDDDAANRLVADLLDERAIARLYRVTGAERAGLVPVRAFEDTGVNDIPDAMIDAIIARSTRVLGHPLAWEVIEGIVQVNLVSHTDASPEQRLIRQPYFDGAVPTDLPLIVVDDHTGQGGTLASLRGYLENRGGHVVAATTLSADPGHERLALRASTLRAVRSKHGSIENWWRQRFDYGFDGLSHGEARYLLGLPDALGLRDRLAAFDAEGNSLEAETEPQRLG